MMSIAIARAGKLPAFPNFLVCYMICALNYSVSEIEWFFQLSMHEVSLCKFAELFHDEGCRSACLQEKLGIMGLVPRSCILSSMAQP